MESLCDRVVIVTGSSSGIGAACAEAFAHYGAKVVICGRNKQRLDEVSESCRAKSSPDRVHSVRGDLADENSIRDIVNSTIERFGTVHTIVHCAGYGFGTGTDVSDSDDMRALFHLHVVAAFLLVKLSLPHLRKNRGSVVIMSSLLGIYPMEMNLAYCVTKGAQDHLSRLLAAELEPQGIRVNSINPGWVRTPVLEHSGIVPGKFFGEILFRYFDTLHPVGRCGTSEEIAEYTAWVATDASAVNGQNLQIDGGAGVAHGLECRKTALFSWLSFFRSFFHKLF